MLLLRLCLNIPLRNTVFPDSFRDPKYNRSRLHNRVPLLRTVACRHSRVVRESFHESNSGSIELSSRRVTDSDE